MPEKKGVTIRLTEKQRAQIKRATGEEHTEVKFERAPLGDKAAGKRLLNARTSGKKVLNARTSGKKVLNARTSGKKILNARTAGKRFSK